MKIYASWFVITLMLASTVFAQSTRLLSSYALNYTLPSDRWVVSTETPEAAIKAMVADMTYQRKKKGEAFDSSALSMKAKELLTEVNSLYIYNPETEAYLMLDISSHTCGSVPPTAKSINRSVAWVVAALKDHADVADLSAYRTVVEDVEISGLENEVRISSDHPQFREPHHFIGIIGYAYPYWVFIYYNDKVKDRADLEEMKQIMASFKLEKVGGAKIKTGH